jgi:hypothetical protein
MKSFWPNLLLFCSIVVSSPLLASQATVSQLLSNPTIFDRQHVTVSGTAQYVRPKTSRRGNDYETFNLCEQACVNVFTWGHPHIDNGQQLTVNGTFQAVKHVGPYTFRNEIEADEGSL